MGTSSDGIGAGLLAPQTGGQQLAIRRAYTAAALAPSSLALVEAHGTGIPLGDKTEIESLTACFGSRTGLHQEKPSIALGSVKSMVGHLLPASGMASLIKCALALYHRVLPPTLHVAAGASQLTADSPFYIATQTRPWIHGDRESPRRAGINAFGFGGINAHAILEESPQDDLTAACLERRWPLELVVVSAADRESLCRRIRVVLDWLHAGEKDASLREGASLLDVAAALTAEPGACRLALVAKDLDDLQGKLTDAARLLDDADARQIQDRRGIFWYRQPLAADPGHGVPGRVAFMFPGEGSQYPNMLAQLCRCFPEVRRQFDLADAGFARTGFGQPLSRLIFPLPEEKEAAGEAMLQLEGAVASVIIAERALATLLGHLGLKADAVVGHSSGEFVALWAAGAFALADDDAVVDWIASGALTAQRIARSGLCPRPC